MKIYISFYFKIGLLKCFFPPECFSGVKPSKSFIKNKIPWMGKKNPLWKKDKRFSWIDFWLVIRFKVINYCLQWLYTRFLGLTCFIHQEFKVPQVCCFSPVLRWSLAGWSLHLPAAGTLCMFCYTDLSARNLLKENMWNNYQSTITGNSLV